MEQTQTIPLTIYKHTTLHCTEFHSRNIWKKQHSVLINHLILIFKFYIYSGRNTKQLNFDILKKKIKKIKELEKELTGSNKLKSLNKWRPIDHVIDWYSIQIKKERRAGVISFIFRLFLFAFFFFFLVFLFSFFPLFIFL